MSEAKFKQKRAGQAQSQLTSNKNRAQSQLDFIKAAPNRREIGEE